MITPPGPARQAGPGPKAPIDRHRFRPIYLDHCFSCHVQRENCLSIPAAEHNIPDADRLARAAVVIPVYNHEQAVGGVVKKALALGWPVVVVDDGSTDRTTAILEAIPGLELIRHETNQGKGSALISGLSVAAALADWAVTLDADGQHDPAQAMQLMEAALGGPRGIVVGRRRGMDGPDVPWTSRWGSRWSNFWVWLSCGHWFPDTQCGFRVYPLPETLRLAPKARRFEYELEVLVRAIWSGLPVRHVDIDVEYRPAGGRVSHFQPGPDFWRNTKAFARLIAMRVLLPRSRRAWRRGR